MLDFCNNLSKNMHALVLAQADELIGNMGNAIEHSVTGRLKKSLRKKDVTQRFGNFERPSVLVMAGGATTTKGEKSGPHDYSLDVEFGNRKQAAEPFFYNTARLYRQGGLEQFRETIDEAVEENNRVRDNRANNYSNSGVTVSHGTRGGAIVIHKGKR
jgi:hypothetical protein